MPLLIEPVTSEGQGEGEQRGDGGGWWMVDCGWWVVDGRGGSGVVKGGLSAVQVRFLVRFKCGSYPSQLHRNLNLEIVITAAYTVV